MKRTVLPIVVVAIVSIVSMTSGGAATAEDSLTLTGEFMWTFRNTTGALEAIFTPTGEGTWDVAFHFEFRDRPHVYTGTAEGSLTSGELKGTVFNDGKDRTFVFSGTVKDGKFTGTHAEVGTDGEQPTGTFSLGR